MTSSKSRRTTNRLAIIVAAVLAVFAWTAVTSSDAIAGGRKRLVVLDSLPVPAPGAAREEVGRDDGVRVLGAGEVAREGPGKLALTGPGTLGEHDRAKPPQALPQVREQPRLAQAGRARQVHVRRAAALCSRPG